MTATFTSLAYPEEDPIVIENIQKMEIALETPRMLTIDYMNSDGVWDNVLIDIYIRSFTITEDKEILNNG